MSKKIEQLQGDLFIHSQFWNSKLKSLSHPTAIRMAEDLDPNFPLGIGDANENQFWKGFKHCNGKKDSNIDFLLRIKKKHPQKIVLVQIGEFYESWALDSVFLVEYCGINRMGRKGPRAGMPLANIQNALNDLTNAGFSVVVCEQADDIHKNGRKIRFISEIITPSSPTYTYGLAMNNKLSACFPEAPPEFGIATNSKGIKIVEINPDLRTSLILEGLTEEAAIIRLNRYSGRMNRVFLHNNVPKNILEAINLKFQNHIKITGYSSSDFAKRMEELIKIDLDLDAKISFFKTKQLSIKNLPNPLYQGTAEQIGILEKRGIPNLIEMMLPKGSPATCQHIIRNLLLNPPSLEFAKHLRQAIIDLKNNSKELPSFIVSNPVKYVKTLNKNEANPEILKDLFILSQIFLDSEKKLSKKFVEHILEIVSYICSIKADRKILKDISKKIINILEPIIPNSDDSFYCPKNELISKYLFENIEDEFRGRIAKTSTKKLEKLYDQTLELAKKYEESLEKNLIKLINQEKKNNSVNNKKLALSYDIHNKAIWLRGTLKSDDIKKYNLIRPIDRYQKEVKDRFSTKLVENSLKKYKESALKTAEEIKLTLKKASKDLSPYCLPIIHLATFSNLTKTLYLHIKECQPKNWSSDFELIKSKDNKDNNIIVNDFFPYWMRKSEAILNSLKIDNSLLLTGHNMSGKSTLIRSLATTTILASVGFMFPAKKISMTKEIDGWFVRTGANDDPEAGLSAFAVEMSDLKVALRDASSKSFLLIDELGKGTESRSGHAIAASILEYLAQNNIRSIFSTHWHEIFFNKTVNLDKIKLIQMYCKNNEPTYKVKAGKDLNSSAFYTAQKIGIEDQIINRAKEIATGYLNNNLHHENKKILKEDSKRSFQYDFFNKQENDNNNYQQRLTDILAKKAEEGNLQFKELKESEMPPLDDIGFSVVYIMKTKNNFFYVGESDNFLQRVKSHRQKFSDQKCEFFYITIKQGKSQARKIEQQLILEMKNQGFAMLSIGDSDNFNFGSN